MNFIKKYLWLVFIIIVFKMQAQTSRVHKDSVLRIIALQSGIEKMNSLDVLFQYYINVNTDTAFYYAEELRKVSEDTNNKSFMALSYEHTGMVYFRNGKFPKAAEEYLKTVEIYKKQKKYKKLASVYKELSRINYYNNNLSKSVEYTFKSLKIFEKLKDKQGIAGAYSNLGSLYGASGNFKKALKYYFAVLKSSEQIPEILKVKLFLNIGSQYKHLNMSDSAIWYYNKSLKISRKNNFINETATNYYNIGDLYGHYIKNKDSALYYLNLTLKILNKNNINLQKAVYAAIGKTYFEKKEYFKSIAPLNKSLEISEKLHNLNGKEIAHFYLYRSYQNIGNYKKSLYHHEKYYEAKDSIKYEQANVEIENLKSKYENAKNKLTIEKLEEKQKSDTKIRIMLLALLFLFILIFALIIRSFVLKRKKNILEKELLKTEKEKLDENLQYKTRELTSQALMMLQKNKLLKEISNVLSEIEITGSDNNKELTKLKRRLRYSMQSEKDWEVFRKYFEELNKNFFVKLKKINKNITPSEMKLAVLVKLGFSIKETASLLNISDGSVKTARYNLRKKMGLQRSYTIYDRLNEL
ncbi:MAG: tetratricopeptide repeat protein [Chlorobi bacterium]|nr:tetratricopeptide repeat protein [Chlorobiota bacterium]